MNLFGGAVGLAVVYLVLTGNFQLSNIVMALIIGLLIIALLRPQRRRADPRAWPAAVWAVLKYSAILTKDMIISGIQVAAIVLSPSLPIKQGNVRIPTRCSSDLAQALSAHAITLTPGEMVVEMADGGVMYTHTLDATHAEEHIAEAQHMREELLNKIVT